MKKLVLVVLMAFFTTMVLSGCWLTDKVVSLKDGFGKGNVKTESNSPTVVIETPNNISATGEAKTLTLYFIDSSGSKLTAEQRKVAKVTGVARSSMEELIKGPKQAGLKPALPASTRLLDINVKPDGLAIVDFSGDLIKDLPASATSEKLAVYSIVNTLTQFPTVQKVELRVDGKKVDTLLGYVKIDQALDRNTSLIK